MRNILLIFSLIMIHSCQENSSQEKSLIQKHSALSDNIENYKGDTVIILNEKDTFFILSNQKPEFKEIMVKYNRMPISYSMEYDGKPYSEHLYSPFSPFTFTTIHDDSTITIHIKNRKTNKKIYIDLDRNLDVIKTAKE